MESKTDITGLKEQKNTALIVLCIAAFVSLSFGFGYAIPSVLCPVIKGHQVAKWSKQNCTIIKKSVKTHEVVGGKSRGIAYSVDIQYLYDYQGENYLSNKYDFQDEIYKQFYDKYEDAMAIVDSFDPNCTNICYVNPQKPSEAVLSTKIYKSFKKSFLSLVFIFVGLAMIVLCIKEKKGMANLGNGLLVNQRLPKTYSSIKVRLFYFTGYLLMVLASLILTFLVGNDESNKTNYLISRILFGGMTVVGILLAIKSLFKAFILPVKVTLNPANLRVGETLKINWKVGESLVY